MVTPSPHALAELKERPGNDCATIAEKFGARLRKSAGRVVGPCPLCSQNLQSKRATKFEIKDDGEAWVCAGECRAGGDVIKLVMLHERIDFRAAVEWLGGPRQVDPVVAEARAKEREAKRKKRDADSDEFRQRERRTMYDIWNRAKPITGTLAEAYLRHRGINPPSFDGVRLRFVEAMPFYHGEEEVLDPPQAHGTKYRPRVIYRGPAMVAPLTDNAGKFRGCQFTWIDLSQRNGKAIIIDPDTGEPVDVKGRKSRGSTGGAHIDLIGSRTPERLIGGEGSENPLSVWYALQANGIDLSKSAAWALIDVGNIGGQATEQVSYPGPDGKLKRCAGPDPDLGQTNVVALPPTVKDVVLLGDNKDAFMVHCACYRGAQRWWAVNDRVVVRLAWADERMDFNDMVRGEETAAVTEGV